MKQLVSMFILRLWAVCGLSFKQALLVSQASCLSLGCKRWYITPYNTYVAFKFDFKQLYKTIL